MTQLCKVYIENSLIIGMDIIETDTDTDNKNVINYDLIRGKKFPLAFERDNKGNIISITEAPTPSEPTSEEILLTALLEIKELKEQILRLEED